MRHRPIDLVQTLDSILDRTGATDVAADDAGDVSSSHDMISAILRSVRPLM